MLNKNKINRNHLSDWNSYIFSDGKRNVVSALDTDVQSAYDWSVVADDWIRNSHLASSLDGVDWYSHCWVPDHPHSDLCASTDHYVYRWSHTLIHSYIIGVKNKSGFWQIFTFLGFYATILKRIGDFLFWHVCIQHFQKNTTGQPQPISYLSLYFCTLSFVNLGLGIYAYGTVDQALYLFLIIVVNYLINFRLVCWPHVSGDV